MDVDQLVAHWIEEEQAVRARLQAADVMPIGQAFGLTRIEVGADRRPGWEAPRARARARQHDMPDLRSLLG